MLCTGRAVDLVRQVVVTNMLIRVDVRFWERGHMDLVQGLTGRRTQAGLEDVERKRSSKVLSPWRASSLQQPRSVRL